MTTIKPTPPLAPPRRREKPLPRGTQREARSTGAKPHNRTHASIIFESLRHKLQPHCIGEVRPAGALAEASVVVPRLEITCTPKKEQRKNQGELLPIEENEVIRLLRKTHKIKIHNNGRQITLKYMTIPLTIHFKDEK